MSDGKIISSVNSIELFNTDKNINSLTSLFLNVDFLIYTETNTISQDRQITYKKIIDPEQYMSGDKSIFHCEPTDYTFLLTEIIIGENKIMINLKDEHCNYFVKGNKFNSKFVKYYLSKCNLEKIENYIIQFLDQNVNEVKIQGNKTILLDKDKYTIVEDLLPNKDNDNISDNNSEKDNINY